MNHEHKPLSKYVVMDGEDANHCFEEQIVERAVLSSLPPLTLAAVQESPEKIADGKHIVLWNDTDFVIGAVHKVTKYHQQTPMEFRASLMDTPTAYFPVVVPLTGACIVTNDGGDEFSVMLDADDLFEKISAFDEAALAKKEALFGEYSAKKEAVEKADAAHAGARDGCEATGKVARLLNQMDDAETFGALKAIMAKCDAHTLEHIVIKGAEKMLASQQAKDAADEALAAFLQDDEDEEGTQHSAAFGEGATQEVGFNS